MNPNRSADDNAGQGKNYPHKKPTPESGRERGKQAQQNRRPVAPGLTEKLKMSPPKTCAICQKPIFDLAGAIADKESGEPVHFDCAIERISKAESLAPNEKVVYIGAGNFAVVEYKNGIDGAFTVKRRFHWEKEGEKQVWRKEISSYISRI